MTANENPNENEMKSNWDVLLGVPTLFVSPRTVPARAGTLPSNCEIWIPAKEKNRNKTVPTNSLVIARKCFRGPSGIQPRKGMCVLFLGEFLDPLYVGVGSWDSIALAESTVFSWRSEMWNWWRFSSRSQNQTEYLPIALQLA